MTQGEWHNIVLEFDILEGSLAAAAIRGPVQHSYAIGRHMDTLLGISRDLEEMDWSDAPD